MLFFASLFSLARAETVEVTMGLAPADLHTVEVEVGARPQTVRFESGVPLEATVSVAPHPAGYQLVVDLVALRTRVDRAYSGQDRALIEAALHGVRKGAHIAQPALVLPKTKGSRCEYIVGSEMDDVFYGVMVTGRAL
ncbi:MAG: hypothetical protein H6737_16025 [Alphaproteobacteria bacterium]|nr:hypothetical protein [Alphaproteobacteria bacterium]